MKISVSNWPIALSLTRAIGFVGNYIPQGDVLLSYRYGVDEQIEQGWTLSAIAEKLGIGSEERVRQIEKLALISLAQIMFGRTKAKELDPDEVEQAKSFSSACGSLHIVTDMDLETVWGVVIEDDNDWAMVNLLMSVLKFKYLKKCLPHRSLSIRRTWYGVNIRRERFCRIMKAIRDYLQDTPTPITTDNILQHFVDRQIPGGNEIYVRGALKTLQGIEFLPEGKYWFEMDYLRTITSKIYRILYQHGEPMHLDEIVNAMDSYGYNVKRPSIQSRLTDGPFYSWGRSGYWALQDQPPGAPKAVTIGALTLQFGAEQAGVFSLDEAFRFVQERRPDNIALNSVKNALFKYCVIYGHNSDGGPLFKYQREVPENRSLQTDI